MKTPRKIRKKKVPEGSEGHVIAMHTSAESIADELDTQDAEMLPAARRGLSPASEISTPREYEYRANMNTDFVSAEAAA